MSAATASRADPTRCWQLHLRRDHAPLIRDARFSEGAAFLSTVSEKRTKRSVSRARLAAYHILRRVEEEGAYSSVLLALTTDDLSAADRRLCYELVLGVLRRQIWLDRLIEHLAARPADELDPVVRRVLRLGLYQLRCLTRVPPSAAVNDAVNLVHHARRGSAAGLVNAVLRRAAREAEFDPVAAIADPVERLSVESSHPIWLLKRWIDRFGMEEARAFARANNEPAPVAFRLTPRAESGAVLQRLREHGVKFEASSVAPCGWRARTMDGTLRALAREGLIYLQDEASQLVACVLGAKAGERVFDACAAPGSKATLIAVLTDNRATVIASDLHLHRLHTVRALARQQGAEKIHLVNLDAERTLPFEERTFHRVLVDAPCTGTGTLRRNPEIRYRLRPSDIAELQARQRRILLEAAKVARDCGRLVYSTCSVEPEENEEVVGELLRAHASARIAWKALPSALSRTEFGVRTWPHREGTDGFFFTALEFSGAERGV